MYKFAAKLYWRKIWERCYFELLKPLKAAFKALAAIAAFITILANFVRLPGNWSLIVGQLPDGLTGEWVRLSILVLCVALLVWILYSLIPLKIPKLPPRVASTLRNDEVYWIDPDPEHTIRHVGHNDVLLVEAIGLRVMNRRKWLILVEQAYIKSLNTGAEIEFTVNSIPAKEAEIQPHAEFILWAPLPNTGGEMANNSIQGMKLDDFKKNFSDFVCVLRTRKKSYKLAFNEAQTEKWIQNKIAMSFPSSGGKASVLRKRRN